MVKSTRHEGTNLWKNESGVIQGVAVERSSAQDKRSGRANDPPRHTVDIARLSSNLRTRRSQTHLESPPSQYLADAPEHRLRYRPEK